MLGVQGSLFLAVCMCAGLVGGVPTIGEPVPAGAAEGAPSRSLERISVTDGGDDALGSSNDPSISSSGRYVAFSSTATNLVPGDENERSDVFVRDLLSARTTRVSVDYAGGDTNGDSDAPSISADGRFVAFQSLAGDLLSDLRPASAFNIYVRDLALERTTLVSVTTEGTPASLDAVQPALSDDGRSVAFTSISDEFIGGEGTGTLFGSAVYVRDLTHATTARVSVDPSGGDPDAPSGNPSISGNGRYVAFESYAGNLVTGQPLPQDAEIYRRDRQSNVTTRVTAGLSERSYGMPDISADGNTVAFYSGSSSAHVDVRDIATGKVTRINAERSRYSERITFGPKISGDGRRTGFSSNVPNGDRTDTNEVDDVFLADAAVSGLTRVSAAAGGASEGGAYDIDLSSTGRSVAFASYFRLLPEDDDDDFDVYVSRANATCDLLVRRRSDGVLNGDNIYETAGTKQSRSHAITAGGKWTYAVLVQNDDDVPRTLTVRATGPTRFSARFFVGYYDVTGSVTSTGLTLPDVPSGAIRTLAVQFGAPRDAPPRSADALVVRVSSPDPACADATRLGVVVAP